MTFDSLKTPLFYIGQHYVSILGLLAFLGFFALGLILARFFQSSFVRRLFSRFRLDVNFIANINHYTLALRFTPERTLEMTAHEASGLIRNGRLVGQLGK